MQPVIFYSMQLQGGSSTVVHKVYVNKTWHAGTFLNLITKPRSSRPYIYLSTNFLSLIGAIIGYIIQILKWRMIPAVIKIKFSVDLHFVNSPEFLFWFWIQNRLVLFGSRVCDYVNTSLIKIVIEQFCCKSKFKLLLLFVLSQKNAFYSVFLPF